MEATPGIEPGFLTLYPHRVADSHSNETRAYAFHPIVTGFQFDPQTCCDYREFRDMKKRSAKHTAAKAKKAKKKVAKRKGGGGTGSTGPRGRSHR